MPYQGSKRLPAEKASKLGHLEVIRSPLVQKLCKSFEDPNSNVPSPSGINWQALPESANELTVVFSTDGSLQVIENPHPPYKAIAFVKTALLKVDQFAIDKLDKETPNPFAIRDIMKDSALFHSTAFPLRHVFIPGKTVYQAVREIIFESIKDKGLNDALDGAMMDTLKWLIYEKWNERPKKQLEAFGCPHCNKNVATLQFDEEKGVCPSCKGKIFITDMFGLHLNMKDDFAPKQVAFDYMSVSETLMILTPIRYFWDTNREILEKCLMVKDGPLSLRATLSKLAAPIRRFFRYAKDSGVEVALLGQEKSGMFFDNLMLIGSNAPSSSVFIPNNQYIRDEIQHSNSVGVYGQDTNYGAKIFLKYSDYHKMVLNIPTGERGEFVTSPDASKLIAFERIIATLPRILSHRFEGALLPIELANGIASLSTYPSAKALELFSSTASQNS